MAISSWTPCGLLCQEVGGGHDLVPQESTSAVPLPQLGGVIQSTAEPQPPPRTAQRYSQDPQHLLRADWDSSADMRTPAAVQLMCTQRLSAIVLGTQRCCGAGYMAPLEAQNSRMSQGLENTAGSSFLIGEPPGQEKGRILPMITQWHSWNQRPGLLTLSCPWKSLGRDSMGQWKESCL